MRSTTWKLLSALTLLLAASCSAAQDTGAVLARQQAAIARLDDTIAQWRRAGDMQAVRPSLRRVQTELEQTTAALSTPGASKERTIGLIRLGSVLRILGDAEAAAKRYGDAAAAARAGGHAALEADALAWRALAFYNQTELGEAEAEIGLALPIAEAAGDPEVLARALDVRATIQTALRDLAGAADTADREVAVAEKLADPMAGYFARLTRSDIFLKLAQRCDFLRDFDPCLDAAQRADDDMTRVLHIAEGLGHEALAASSRGMLRGIEARRMLIQKRKEHEIDIGQMPIFRPTTAEQVAVSSNYVPPPGPMNPALQALLAEYRQEQGQYAAFSQGVRAVVLYIEGLEHELAGRNEKALESYLRAVQALERDRRSLRDERSRTAFVEDRIVFYHAAATQLLQAHRNEQAFDLLERSRGRALADLLASRSPALRGADEAAAAADVASLRSRIAELQGRLLMTTKPDTRAETQRRIDGLEADLRGAMQRMQKVAPRLAALVESTPPRLADLQASMKAEGYESLQYLVTDTGIVLWHITADSLWVRNVFLPRTQLRQKVAALRKSLHPRTPYDETAARELFLYLVQPAMSRIRSDKLVIVPHDALSQLPFQALIDPHDGRYFGQKRQISVVPSNAVLLSLPRDQPLDNVRVYAFAGPDLTYGKDELTAIVSVFGRRVSVPPAAQLTEAEARAGVGGHDVLHLAVHGTFNTREPMLSHLSLTPDGRDDGMLTAAEMFGLELAGTRLVVLSACETGRTETTEGSETLGMSRALLYAGAGSLVLSGWKVNSRSTGAWMRAFYESARTEPVKEAARRAADQVRADPQTRHPFHWAAFSVLAR